MSRSAHVQTARRGVVVLAAALALAAVGLVPAAQAKAPAGAYDRAFLTDMISHHAMAVDMGEMAKMKAVHPELREVGEEIVRTQSAEIRRMRSWLKRWYGKSVRVEMPEHEMEDMEELDGADGAEFEVRFMAIMSVHHAQAIERAKVARRRARHREVRSLARAIVRAQEREVDQFRDWLVAWYAR